MEICLCDYSRFGLIRWPDNCRKKGIVSYYVKNDLQVYSDINETDKGVLEFANYQTLFGKDYYVILRPSLGFE